MERKISSGKIGLISKNELNGIFQGWNAYAKWADSYKLKNIFYKKILSINNNHL